ncbi:MAG: anaerobic ribonucleoside-triphosphate reductase activating protein [Lentisphaeria bacterium]|nr:anaerobic ribonucleoside-triphosphate reductase activating protein [Lentisphaeria bacterium]
MKNMRFGLRKMTLLDFPGRVACTVFTCGCNFRCPFCHNASLVRGSEADLELGSDELFRFLEKRRGLLDGVAVTGGEPLLHAGTPELLARIKELGFAVKLDTNGSFPEVLEHIIDSGSVDLAAMDIKSSPDKYDHVCGRPGMFEKVSRSIGILKKGKIPCEFRTTVVKGLHDLEDVKAIGRLICGAERYFLQNFVETEDLLEPWRDFSGFDREELLRMLEAVKEFVPAAAIRGE